MTQHNAPQTETRNPDPNHHDPVPSYAERVKKVNDLIAHIKVAMLTTRSADGNLHSRPMMTQENEFDGDVWFFASADSEKVGEIRMNPGVNVVYATEGRYVSLAGTAQIVTEVAKKRSLWNESLKAWFEEGPDAPSVVLIKVAADSAQYWDGPTNVISKAVAMVKVMLTGNHDAFGESARVEL